MNSISISSLTQISKKRILVVGKLEDEHFPGLAVLLEQLPIEVVQREQGELLPCVQEYQFDLILLPQVRPLVNEASHKWLTNYTASMEAKPILMQLLGTWCEGEGRTGKVQEGWKRLFWHQATRWLEAWLLPTSRMQEDSHGSYRLVEVDADREMVETLREALKPYGWYVISYDGKQSPTHASLGIWQGTQISGRESARLSGFANRYRNRKNQYRIPVIAMVDFPRTEIVAAAGRLGVSEVIGLPVSLDELNLTIESVYKRSIGISCQSQLANQIDGRKNHPSTIQRLPIAA